MAREKFPPPAALDDQARTLWRRSRDELLELELWRPTDVAALERYVRAEQRAREARARLEKSGWTVPGSTGQPVAAPDVRIAREAERDAHDYASALLLTPASRARHGVVAAEEPEHDALAEIAAKRARRLAELRRRAELNPENGGRREW